MTNFLFDTNVLLWYFWGSSRIEPVRELIAREDINVFFSSASLWETAIKVRSGKLNLDVNELYFFARKHAFLELSVSSNYMKAYLELPNLHKDPFDHMLLAQAISSPMRLITGDARLAEYSPLVMLV